MSFEFADRKWGTDAIGTASGEITWSMNLSGLMFDSAHFSIASFEAEVRRAFETWQQVAQLEFVEVASGGLVNLFVTGDSRTPSQQNNPYASNLFGDPSGVVALARSYFGSTDPVPGNGIRIMDRGEVLFDQAENWSPTGSFLTVDFFAVAVHEIGHILGLGHVNDNSEIMNPYIYASTLGDGDIAGVQTIYGAPQWTGGADTIDFSDIAVGQNIYGLAGVDQITGSRGDDRIFGGAGADTVFGNAGDDTIIDALGENTLHGEDGNDLIVSGGSATTASGGDGQDILIGGSADDVLSGDAGNDTIRGDAASSFLFGDDRLIAGAGDDFLEGGGGADTFVFRPSEGRNEIARLNIDPANPGGTTAVGADFVSGVDRIALNGFDYSNPEQVLADLAPGANGVQLTHQGTTIVFYGLDLTDLSAGDFVLNDLGIG